MPVDIPCVLCGGTEIAVRANGQRVKPVQSRDHGRVKKTDFLACSRCVAKLMAKSYPKVPWDGKLLKVWRTKYD